MSCVVKANDADKKEMQQRQDQEKKAMQERYEKEIKFI